MQRRATDFNGMRALIEARLTEILPADTLPPQNLGRAIRYATLAPGKRLRGILTLLAAATGPRAEMRRALDTACAIEMVHAASLVIDDLPIMDNAMLRRGQPCTHRVFGEDTAMLTALALLNRAFGVIAADGALSANLRNEIVVLLHQAVGTQGLIGGQELDLHETFTTDDLTGLSEMYQRKTGILFIAAADAGGRIAALDATALTGLRSFARYLGLAYQLADDLSDVRDAGVTEQADQPNMVAAIGVERTRRLFEKLLQHAVRQIAPLGDAAVPLEDFARQLFKGVSVGAKADAHG
jgi:geranylgeranyl diphosphate synthase type II